MKKTKLKTIVNLILDESGSMSSIKRPTIDGVNEYINSLKSKDGLFYFTLTKFDSEGIRTPYVNTPIIDVNLLDEWDYKPNAMTPLYDAIGETVNKVENQIKNEKGKVAVLVVIMTDGGENSSKEFTQAKINSMITKLQEKGNWTFVFLGANQDSFSTSQGLGIYMNNTMNWQASAVGVRGAMDHLADATAFYASSMDTAAMKGSAALSSDSFFTDDAKEEEANA